MKAVKIKKTLRTVKIIVEKHPDGFIAYPLQIKGACVGQGDSFEEAFECVSSMLKQHIDVFGRDVFEDNDSPVLEAYVAEVRMKS